MDTFWPNLFAVPPAKRRADKRAAWRRYRERLKAKDPAKATARNNRFRLTNPAGYAESQRRYREKFPEKVAARAAVHNAVRSGRLVRRPCEVCGSAFVEAHHADYFKPLEVRWLCKIHHEELEHPSEQQERKAA